MGGEAMRARICGVVAAIALLAGCESPGGGRTDATPGPTETESAGTDPLAGEEICELLGFDAVEALEDSYDYVAGEPEETDGVCNVGLTKDPEGPILEHWIRVLASSATWFTPEEAAAGYEYLNGPDNRDLEQQLTFPEAAEQRDLSGSWDEGVVVFNQDWSHGPEFIVRVRGDTVMLRFSITMGAIAESREPCEEDAPGASCVIDPVIVQDWIDDELLPEAFSNLQEAGYLPE